MKLPESSSGLVSLVANSYGVLGSSDWPYFEGSGVKPYEHAQVGIQCVSPTDKPGFGVGLSVLHYAVDGGSPDIVSMLLLTGHGLTAGAAASASSAAPDAQPSSSGATELAAGPRPPASAFSPVHLAARRGHAHLLPQLLRSGLDPAATDGSGRSALHHAALGYGEAATAAAAPDMAALAAGTGGTAAPGGGGGSGGKHVPVAGGGGGAVDHQRVAELLLLTGCSVHGADSGQATALLYAAGERMDQSECRFWASSARK